MAVPSVPPALPVDAVSGLLDAPRARGAFLLRSILAAPWGLRVADRAPLTVVVPVRGEVWIRSDSGARACLGPLDVALVRGPTPYDVVPGRHAPVRVRIGPGQECETLVGEDLSVQFGCVVRTWNNTDPHDPSATEIITGTYDSTSAVGRRLLDALPDLAVVPADGAASPPIALLAAELVCDRPGQGTVLDRALDLVTVHALRAYFDRNASVAPGWYAAATDPVVGRALDLVHTLPDRRWTLETLASECAVSRATLARRFGRLVGESPMTYLTRRRLDLAADLLAEPGATLTAVSRRVGYATGFALSAAFKREFGTSPREFLRAAR